MSQIDKAKRFRDLHAPGRPLVLYNIWDAGSAKTVAAGGARAIATSSWSMAVAQGYADGQAMPLDLTLAVVAQVARATELPLTVDFEGGYAATPAEVAANVARVLAAGAIGVNFEDQVIGGAGLYSIDEQSARVRAIREMADATGQPVFINARTDLFLKAKTGHAELIAEALTRAEAYLAAGADGFFTPGLIDPTLIAELCRRSPIPVNIMMTSSSPSVEALAALGVARVSFGPIPYLSAQKDMAARLAGMYFSAGD